MTTLTNSAAAGPRAAETESADADFSVKERPASQSDVDKFESAIKEKSDKRESAGHGSKGEKSSSQNELSSIFSSLMGAQGQAQPQGQGLNLSHSPDPALNKSESAVSLSNASLQELADSLVERILISDPKFSSGSEVRLLLGQNTGLLSGSEIILRRNLEGMLAVEISCHNKDQFKKFVEVRSELTEALERCEKNSVNLIISQAQEDQEAYAGAFNNAFHPNSF